MSSVALRLLDAHPECVQIICYYKVHHPPFLIHAKPCDNSESVCFWGIEDFKKITDWPRAVQEIYDVYQDKFVTLHTFARYPKSKMNPFYITKPFMLEEDDCLGLALNINKLKDGAQQLPNYIPNWGRHLPQNPEPRLVQEVPMPGRITKRKRNDSVEEFYAFVTDIDMKRSKGNKKDAAHTYRRRESV